MSNQFSEKGYVNHVGILCHTTVDVILFLAYFIELIKGSRTPGYIAVFSLLCIVPIVVEFILYKQNEEHPAIMHCIGISYGILYLFAIFTTTSLLTCMYAFPMFMIVILFGEIRFGVFIGIGAVLGNVVYVIYHAVTVGYTKAEIPDVEIRVAAILVSVIFMIVATKAYKRVSTENVKVIAKQSEEAKTLTASILTISGDMVDAIEDVSVKMEQLGQSMEQINGYMGQVSSGSTETAEAVQEQLLRTEEIQQHIAQVKETAGGIDENMDETVKMVENGRKQMAALAEQVEKSMKANSQVLKQMQALGEYTGKMNTIIETITSIANSTGMLALNASIEAARAGEAGRGFAVVAGQISTLANQTKEATVNITELIGNINAELKSVETAVDVVTESNRANEENTKVVTENFEDITRGTDDIRFRTEELLQVVLDLENANKRIVDSIQTISAITEEVSAHANETYGVCEQNAGLVREVTSVVGELNENAEKLKK